MTTNAKSRTELEAMTIDALRSYGRTVCSNIPKTKLVFMSKKELIETIITGEIATDTGGNGGNGKNHSAEAKGGNGGDLLTDVMVEILSGKIKAGLDEEKVRALITEELKAAASYQESVTSQVIKELGDTIDKKLAALTVPNRIEIEKKKTGKVIDLGVQHFKFETLFLLVKTGIPVMMVGPAGSGKTHLAEAIAKGLEIPFYPMSVNQQTSKSDLMGYMHANGGYVPSAFRLAYEKGGLFLLDEADAGNPNVLATLNGATSNGSCLFPDNTLVQKHENFRIMGGANTYCKGGDRIYVGRNPIDGATLDRFWTEELPYDDALESALCDNGKWLSKVRAVRKAVEEMPDVKHIVSPRASIYGAKMLAAGLKEADCMEALIWKGLNKETRQRVIAKMSERG